MIEALEQFRPHQEELRRRLIRSFLAVALTSSVAYLFKETLAAWCIHPLQRAYPPLEKLVYTNLPEAFLSYIKLSLLVGLVVAALAAILYNLGAGLYFMLVENGGTVVLGGIFTQTETSAVNKVPLLGDIPVVGHLFKNTVRSANKTELLVFITPKVITDRATVR